MNLTKTKYCNGLQCKKMLWLDEHKPEVKEEKDVSSLMEQGNLVHEIARYLFGEHINIKYTDNLKEMIKDTYHTIESYKDVIITEASFNYNNNFCSVDILIKKNENYEIYEVKSSSDLKDIYINDASYQYYVLTNLGLNVVKCNIVTLNRGYERIGNIELDKLFKIHDITNRVIELQSHVKENIEEINKYMNNELEQDMEIDEYCFKPYFCPFFKYCTRHLEHPNVFDITQEPGITALKLYRNGYVSFKDLLDVKLSNKYRQRIEFEIYDKKDYIDKHNIKMYLKTLSYPLYFLDFETYQMPIPIYDHLHPYEKIPFQYSLHYYEKEGEELKHTEYLGIPGSDPRRELAEQLVHDIPKDVCTLAYNMSFEKSVIMRLANIYPDLKEHLMNIHDHIKDLEDPFSKRYYYSKSMVGSSSIKKVLPSLFPNDPSLNYHNLDLIHNGNEAMDSFARMGNMDGEELKYTRERLLKYCELDTYAMVKIYEKLLEVTK